MAEDVSVRLMLVYAAVCAGSSTPAISSAISLADAVPVITIRNFTI